MSIICVLIHSSGIAAAVVAILGALCGWWSFSFAGKAQPDDQPGAMFLSGPSTMGAFYARSGGKRVIGKLASGFQAAATLLATATALFGIAATGTLGDSIVTVFVVLACVMSVSSIVIIFANLNRMTVPRAADAFALWYWTWADANADPKDKSAPPPQSVAAETFMRMDPSNAARLKRFHVFPFSK